MKTAYVFKTHCLLRTTYCVLRTTCYLLPMSYYLALTTYYLLLTTYYLLSTKSDHCFLFFLPQGRRRGERGRLAASVMKLQTKQPNKTNSKTSGLGGGQARCVTKAKQNTNTNKNCRPLAEGITKDVF